MLWPGNPRLFLLVILLSVAVFHSALTQVREFRFQNIGIEDGIPAGLVTGIVQDYRGFIWMGTSGGLVRYDGYSFKVFVSIPGDSTSIASNFVSSLAMTSSGALLAGGEDGEISQFEPSSEKFVRHKLRTAQPLTVTAIFQDRQGMNWVGTDEGGIFLLDSALKEVKHFEHEAGSHTSLNSNSISAVTEDREGNILIGTLQGLNVLPSGRQTFESFTHNDADAKSLSNDTVRSICPDAEGGIWIGTNSGLELMDPQHRTFLLRFKTSNFISAIKDQDAGHLWLGTYQGGAYRIEKATGMSTHFLHHPDQPLSLLSNSVQAILVDRSEATWIATDRGVSRITPRGLQFAFYSSGGAMPGNFVDAIAESKQGDVWIGGKFLTKIHADAFLDSARKEGDIHRFLKNEYVTALLCDAGDALWVGTGNGLYRCTRNCARIQACLRGFGVVTMADDHAGTLWLGTPQGLIAFNKEHSRIDHTFTFGQVDSAATGGTNVTKVYIDREDELWVCTEGDGLHLFDRRRTTEKSYRHDPSTTTSISSDRVYDIHEDRAGTLWMTTGAGLDALNRTTGTFTHFTNSDGLPAPSQVLNLQDDERGNLWITAGGPWISKFNPSTKRTTNFFSEGGFHITSVMGAFMKASTGEFFIGGLDGFTRFHPDSITDNTQPPSVQITDLRVAGRPTPIDARLTESGLELSYDENLLGFEFAVLDFISPKRNQRAYRMEGIEPAWVFVEGPRHINYSGLPAGSYTLRIKGANSDGYWNETGISLPIRIKPPWWETWYFRLGGLIVVTSALFGLHRIRVANLLDRERLKSKISAELHDEIGSGLTRIALISDIAMTPGREKAAPLPAETFTRISQLARDLHGAMSDVVWSINPRNDTMESFIQRATTYLNEVCDAKGIKLTLKVDDRIRPLNARPEVLHNLLLVTKEAMTNVLRHSGCSEVGVEILYSDGLIHIAIWDNGRGFDASGEKNGNGLRNMRRRAEELGGKISFQSAQGEGTRLAISIPRREH